MAFSNLPGNLTGLAAEARRTITRNLRLDRAAQLLRRMRVGLAEVAGATGFADQSHLSNAFRRRFARVTRARMRRACKTPHARGRRLGAQSRAQTNGGHDDCPDINSAASRQHSPGRL